MMAGRGDARPADGVKDILCFGDSNTWGSDPADVDRRFPWPARWPGVLQRELGDGCHVVEDALGGRTTVIDDPLSPFRSGLDLLAPSLESHAPLHLVVLMLGTNDVSYSWVSAVDAAEGAGRLVHLIRRSESGPGGAAPDVLLVCPPPVGPLTDKVELYAGAVEKSRAFAAEYARVAAELRCEWIDAGQVIVTSPLDGWHLDATAHERLGVAVAAHVRAMVG